MARDGAIASPRRGAECAARFSAAPNVFENQANTSKQASKANKKEGRKEGRVADGRETNRSKSKSVRKKKHHSRPSQAIFSPRRGLAQIRMNAVFFSANSRGSTQKVRFQAAEPPKNSAWVEQRFVIPKVKNSGHFVQNSGHSSGVLHPATMPIAIFSKRLGGAFSARTGVRTFSDFFFFGLFPPTFAVALGLGSRGPRTREV